MSSDPVWLLDSEDRPIALVPRPRAFDEFLALWKKAPEEATVVAIPRGYFFGMPCLSPVPAKAAHKRRYSHG